MLGRRSQARSYCTVSISEIECDTEPLLPPLIVSPNVPVLALRLVLIVSVEVAPPVVTVTGFGLKLPGDYQSCLQRRRLEDDLFYHLGSVRVKIPGITVPVAAK